VFNDSLNWKLVKLLTRKDFLETDYKMLISLFEKYSNVLKLQEASQSKSILIKMMVKSLKKQEGFWTINNFLEKKHFLEADFKGAVYMGKKMMPLYEQVIYAFLKSWTVDVQKGIPKAVAELDNVLNQLGAIEHPNNFKFLDYYHAKVLIVSQKYSEAREVAKGFLRKSINQSYAWSLMAECTQSKSEQLAYLSKALELQREEKFSIGVRKRMMDIYMEQQQLDIAAKMAEDIIRIRQQNNWSVHVDIHKIRLKTTASFTNKQMQQQLNTEASKAMNYAFENIKSIVAVVTGALKNKPIYFVLDYMGNTHKIRLKGKVKIGQFVEIMEDKIVLQANIIEMPEDIHGAIKRFEGTFKSIKEFGFVKEVFITPKLSKECSDGDMLKGIAIKEINKKTKKQGWKAICFN
jgi:tetratricopeptide (TPR) repeat protein